jgi:hypothetical protein
MMMCTDDPLRCRKGQSGVVRRNEPHRKRIHTEELNADHP